MPTDLNKSSVSQPVSRGMTLRDHRVNRCSSASRPVIKCAERRRARAVTRYSCFPRVHHNPLRHRLFQRIARIISQHDFRSGHDLRRKFLRVHGIGSSRKQECSPARPLRQKPPSRLALFLQNEIHDRRAIDRKRKRFPHCAYSRGLPLSGSSPPVKTSASNSSGFDRLTRTPCSAARRASSAGISAKSALFNSRSRIRSRAARPIVISIESTNGRPSR